MESLTKNVMDEDVSLRESSSMLWELKNDKPEIRQVYGHFLPPNYMKLVDNGLVAKDFNFPAAYHSAVSLRLNQIYMAGEKLTAGTAVQINGSIKMRTEKDGAIVYTPYFNGFYLNNKAYEILKCCQKKTSIDEIASKLGCDVDTVREFLVRALILGIVDVCS